MHSDFHWDLKKARKEGFKISIGQRMTSGPLLRLEGHSHISHGTSNPVLLSKYSEVEILGRKNAPSTFIQASTLISNPQFFLGFHLCGLPIFLGINRATEGHILVLGQTRTGKTLTLAEIAAQANSHGYAVFYVGMKDWEHVVAAAMKAAAEAKTRIDEEGNAVPGIFRYVTKRPGLPSNNFNYLTQESFDLPPPLRASNILMALGHRGAEQDMAQSYYTGAAQAELQKVPWGSSFSELQENLEKQIRDRDTRYATAAARNAIAQQAALETPLPSDHEAQINLADLVRQRAAVYYDACYMDTGPLAPSNAGLFVNALIFAKRKVNPSREHIVVLIIDEAQQFPRAFLKQIVEQCASSGIRLVMAFHTVGQMEEDWETLCMAQVKIWTGAVAGSKTEDFLKHSFGTTVEYQLSFGESFADTLSSGSSLTSGPLSTSETFTEGASQTSGSQFSFTEKEVFAWKPNDTLELNHDRERFVVQVSPAAELAHFGPTPVVCERGGYFLDFSEVSRLSQKVLAESPYTILPGRKLLGEGTRPPLSEALQEKRRKWMSTLAEAAAKARDAMNNGQ